MKKIIFLFAALIAFGSANAQSTTPGQTITLGIPAVALIKVSGAPTAFSFSGTPGTGAGDNFADATSTGTSLQYTSIMDGTSTATQRSIYVTSTAASATATKGFNIAVTGTTPSSAGNGTKGNSNGSVWIVKSDVGTSNTPYTGVGMTFATAGNTNGANQKLITGIKSCYTGIAIGDGTSLTYKASIGGSIGAASILGQIATGDFALLKSGQYTFTVYYTLSDDV